VLSNVLLLALISSHTFTHERIIEWSIEGSIALSASRHAKR